MKIFIMDVTLLLEEDIFQKALSYVDVPRREKVIQLKVREEQARSLGAGLLLQYGLLEPKAADILNQVSVPDILCQTTLPQKISLTYGTNGKPYLNEPGSNLFFSLSHSGDYAVCAFSQEEIGIDLQYKREDIRAGLPGYLFTEQENALLAKCRDREEYKSLFYFLFSAKEAYIKLTGQGMRQELKGLHVIPEQKKILDACTKTCLACLQQFPCLEDYSLVAAQKCPETHIVI